ncbi:ParB/RepB/Spo0J family partition protein [Desulfohalovibrio reitneri]|uniref:ParB/RepB/Spo0J family partition protein n=1 Tax=Desulfohalovibrio reitneri TaxID=1307759 RepID=UPI0004A6C2B4|nr:ParB/RepB/Spo0J family partition protein [Desulfohalovibrio reitneri]
MPEPRGLGRGLEALLGGDSDHTEVESQASGDVRSLPVRSVEPNPTQPRRSFDQEALRDLANSIRHQGVLQPILVRRVEGRDKYELVAGERRWRATQMAGLTKIPALVRDLDDNEALAIALIENLQREDLNPIEEARGLKELQQRLSLNQEKLAQRVGKSRSAVANTLRLLSLPESVQGDMLEGGLTAGHARALMAVTDPDAQRTLMDRIMNLGLSVRQAEAQAAYYRTEGDLPEEGATVRVRSSSPKSSSPKEKDPQLDEAADKLAQALGVKATASGSREKGRISLYFESPEQLAELVERLTDGMAEAE